MPDLWRLRGCRERAYAAHQAGQLRYHSRMQKSVRDIYQAIETPLLSFFVVLLSCVVFLVALWAIVILVRFLMG